MQLFSKMKQAGRRQKHWRS